MKNKSKLIGFSFLLCVLSFVLLTQTALAIHPVDVFGPKTFVRTTGAPNVFQESFNLPTLLGAFTMRVESNKVSSASIKLNDNEIFSPKDFNQTVSLLTKQVTPVLGSNTLNIQLASQPSSYLRITITFLSPVSVKVTSENPEVAVKKSIQFNVNVSGTTDQRVVWSVIEEGAASAGFGTIDSTGLYTAPDYAPEIPFVTIQAQSVANPYEVGTAVVMVRDLGNFGHSNADGDFGAYNNGDFIQFDWADLPEGTAKIVMFRASNKNGPWAELFSSASHLVLKPVRSIFYYDTADNLLPFDTANDYFYKMEAYSATGQLLKSYSPVFVPKYVEEGTGQQSSMLRKSPLILLASLSTLILSTVSSACGSPNDPKFNDPFITEAEFLNNSSMTLQQIRDLLKNLNSWFKGDAESKILDVDGQMIDFAKVVFDAAKAEAINPQLLLTMAQRENGLLFKGKRQKDSYLKSLMNCGSPTTIAQQTQCAAGSLRNRFDELKSGRYTPQNPPWNLSKTTKTLDGVNVKPANAATGALFAYDPEAGIQWGGDDPKIGGNAAFCQLWHGKKLGFAKPCPEPPVPLTISGSDTTTRNSTKQYTVTGCPSAVTWSVSGSGATISSTGLLTAGATACGSLLVTATCAACGTSTTQYVRVTDAGQWVITSYCNLGAGFICTFNEISGKNLYEIRMGGTTYPPACPTNYCAISGYTCNDSSPISAPHTCGGTGFCCVHTWYIYEWRC